MAKPIVREAKIGKTGLIRTVIFGKDKITHGAMFNTRFKGKAVFTNFVVERPRTVPPLKFVEDLSRRIRGTFNKLRHRGIMPVGYRVNLIGNKAVVTLYTTSKVPKRLLSFNIVDIIGGVLGGIAGTISQGFEEAVGVDIIVPDPRAGPDLGTILLAGLIIGSGLFALDIITRREVLLKRGYEPESSFAPIGRAAKGAAKAAAGAAVGAAKFAAGRVL